MDQFTVLSSYTSRNDNNDYDFEYIVADSPKQALIDYLVKHEGYPENEAEEFINDMTHRKIFLRKSQTTAHKWYSDDPYYIVYPGKYLPK